MFLRDRAAIAQALLTRRIPSIAAFRENLEAGALISYGFDLMGLFYDIASYVQRLAGGAKPSDMHRAIAALLHGGQSQDAGIARNFFVGCIRRSGQRGTRMKSSRVHHASRRHGDGMAACGARIQRQNYRPVAAEPNG
jgi:hypothetical protein